MSKPEHLRNAVLVLEEAIAKLKVAKQDLLYARSDQHMPIAVHLSRLEEIHGILTDPECTPELFENVGDSE